MTQTDETIPRQLTVRVTGARTLEFSGQRDVRFLLRPGTASTLDVSVASITLAEFLAAAEGWFAQPEVAVLGLYTGDGEYTLPAGRGTPPTTGPTVPDDPDAKGKLSVTQTTFDRKDAPGSALRFDYALQPCQVTLRDGAKTGSMRCPALAAHTGAVVAMEMNWGKP